MKLRHVLVYDGTKFDLFENKVMVDMSGHPIVWSVEHVNTSLRSDDPPRFWLTYLEAD